MIAVEGVERETVLDPLVPVIERIAAIGDWVAHRMVDVFDLYPKQSRSIMAAFVILAALCATKTQAHAGIILDPITSQFSSITAPWMASALALANSLFLTLAFLTIIYNMTVAYIDSRTVAAITLSTVRTMLGLFVPYAVLVGSTGALFVGNGGLIGAAQGIAGAITGLSVVTAPDTIMLDFIALGWSLPTKTWAAVQAENLTIFSGFAPIVMSALALLITLIIAVIIIGIGVLIAVELTVATLQTTFSIPIAVWTLGFAGSPATAPIATATWGAVLRVIIRFVAILAMAALAIQICTNWEDTLSHTTFNNVAQALNNTGLLITSIELMFGALALGYLTLNLPKLAVAAASGAPAISGVSLVSKGVSGAGDAAGGAVNAVSRGGQQAARGAEAGGAGERTSDGAAAAAGLARGGLAGAAAAVIANRRK